GRVRVWKTSRSCRCRWTHVHPPGDRAARGGLRMRGSWPLIGCAVCLGSGCVIVNPGRVEVSASPKPLVVGAREEPPPATAYGPALERVRKQQANIIDELQQRDWSDVLEEASKWTEQVRTLTGYA